MLKALFIIAVVMVWAAPQSFSQESTAGQGIEQITG
jgi:hypothetical protein